MQYAISRHINGISLNGREYCLDEEDNVLLFDSFKLAKEYLITRLIDCEEEDLQEDLDNGVIQIEIYK